MKKHVTALITAWCCLTGLYATPATPDTEDSSLKVATFNIRYDNSGDGNNRWAVRKDTVPALIAAQGWDIVGMQEVLHHQLQDLLQRLPGYRHVGVGRDDGKTRGEYAPILYDTLRVRLLDSQTFWLSQYPDSAGFIGWDGACTRIATWARFADKRSGKEFLFVNTHFDHVGKEAMRNAARLVSQRIKDLAGNRPVILTGDFNVTADSEPYRILTADPAFLQDVYLKSPSKKGPAYTYHNFGQLPPERRTKIDFIFASPAIEVLQTGIIRENAGTTGHISDHNPHWGIIRQP